MSDELLVECAGADQFLSDRSGAVFLGEHIKQLLDEVFVICTENYKTQELSYSSANAMKTEKIKKYFTALFCCRSTNTP